MNGYIGWHASPSRVTRPSDQRGSGSRSNSAQMKHVSAEAMIRRICGCQPSKAASARAIVARSVQSEHDPWNREDWGDRATIARALGPVLAVPGVVLGPPDEIQQTA